MLKQLFFFALKGKTQGKSECIDKLIYSFWYIYDELLIDIQASTKCLSTAESCSRACADDVIMLSYCHWYDITQLCVSVILLQQPHAASIFTGEHQLQNKLLHE